MREIIYIQAGTLSNYAGTHYWNTQESYFTYDEDDVSIADHSISFKEGRDVHNDPTLCPRLLAFDHKSNFGTLTKDLPVEEASTCQATWHGDVIHQEQEQISQSEYHSLLKDEDDFGDVEEEKAIDTNIRYWSDFSRVFFDPKSIQAVPDASEIVESDWSASRQIFQRYDEDTELMDGSLRLLIEDCHNFQGVQMTQDMPTFGGFSDSFLTAFRDEYPKATILSFACLSNTAPSDVNLENSFQTKQVLNDTLSMRSLSELCDLTVPILPPPRWENKSWFSTHDINKSLYQCSAVLSAHIETATLPLRLRGGSDDLQSFVAHLNWRKSSPFAALGGTLCPRASLTTDDLQSIATLSFHSNGNRTPFARRDVSRGFSQKDLTVFSKWNETCGLKEPFFMRNHLPSYPIPTSFPSIFPGPRPKVLRMMSSLSTSPSMATSLSSYVTFVESKAKRHDSALLAMGLEDDEVRELVNALWDIVDGYGENEMEMVI
ncbi:tubulin domain-containing protein [Melanogaster broomeanus]|nr:tubulin domain-containing protein [Melanogaster broomeanus]